MPVLEIYRKNVKSISHLTQLTAGGIRGRKKTLWRGQGLPIAKAEPLSNFSPFNLEAHFLLEALCVFVCWAKCLRVPLGLNSNEMCKHRSLDSSPFFPWLGGKWHRFKNYCCIVVSVEFCGANTLYDFCEWRPFRIAFAFASAAQSSKDSHSTKCHLLLDKVYSLSPAVSSNIKQRFYY